MKSGELARAVLDYRNASQVMPNDAEPHYQLALVYMGSGEMQAAANELMTAVKVDPRHIAAGLKLAELMAVNTDRSIAKQGYDKAEEMLAASPGSADALWTAAVAELHLEDSKEAVKHLEEALTANPQHLNSSIMLAAIKLRANDIAGAEQILEKGSADAPNSAEHAVVLGRFYVAIQKKAEAEKQFRRAADLDPNNGSNWVALGSLLYNEAKIDEADKAFQRAAAVPDKKYRPLHAVFLFQAHQPEAAIRELEQQYSEDTKDRGARSRLMVAYYKTGRGAEADKILAEALKRNPKDTDGLMQRAASNLAAGKLQDARNDVTEVLHSHSDSAPAHLLSARVHSARGEQQHQISELLEALRLNPKLLPARIDLAHTFTTRHSAKAAIDLLNQAPPEQLHNVDLIVERNIAWMSQNDSVELRKGVDEGLAISHDARLVLQDGLCKLQQKNYREGRASLEQVLEQRPEEWSAVEALAKSYLAEKNSAQAIEIVKKYVSHAPNSASGQQLLGNWLLQNGDIAGARSAFQESKRLNPKSSSGDFSLVKVAVKEGKPDLARELLNGIVSRDPHNAEALLLLADAEVNAGHTAAAIGYYNRVLQDNPSEILALNNLAFILADTETDPDRALALAQKAKELYPENTAVDDTIGWALYKKGRYREALAHLGKAEKSKDAGGKCHLAMVYVKLGDRDRGISILGDVIKENPSSPEVRRAVELMAGR